MSRRPLIPELHSRPWGDGRLSSLFAGASGGAEPIGEAKIHTGDRPPKILVKWISAAENLSVQNHPSAPGFSKREIWCFIEPPRAGRVITGLVGSLSGDDIENRLLYTEVRAGDFLEIPAGCLHALTAGSFLLEIQEPRDITYRVHDWGRGRELHLVEAAAARTDEPVRLIRPGTGRKGVMLPIIARAEYSLSLIIGPLALTADRAGILSFIQGERLGRSYLLSEGDRETSESGESAVWASA